MHSLDEEAEMSGTMSIGLTKATAVAAANVAINHVGLGAFFSQYDIYDYTLRSGKFKLASECPIEGRTNTGVWVKAVCTVVFRDLLEGERADFPIEKVVVTLVTSQGREDEERRRYELRVSTEGFKIRELKVYSL